MNAVDIFFYIFSATALGFALSVVLGKNPISCAFSLVAFFFCGAADYALLQAHFLAAIQILVYAGAIMVLFIFVIMLLNADTPSFDAARSHIAVKILAGLACLGLFAAFVWAFKNSPATAPIADFTPEKI